MALGIESGRHQLCRVPRYNRLYNSPTEVPLALRRLAQSCFAPDPRARISVAQLGVALEKRFEDRQGAYVLALAAFDQAQAGAGPLPEVCMDALEAAGEGSNGASPLVSTIQLSSSSLGVDSTCSSGGASSCASDASSSSSSARLPCFYGGREVTPHGSHTLAVCAAKCQPSCLPRPAQPGGGWPSLPGVAQAAAEATSCPQDPTA
jgi:hypothetical protein